MMAKKVKKRADGDMKEAFQVFDVDGNSIITVDDILALFAKLGQDLGRQDIESLVADAGLESRNAITYDGTGIKICRKKNGFTLHLIYLLYKSTIQKIKKFKDS